MTCEESDICFECLGGATWCETCKKSIIVPDDKPESTEEERRTNETDPDQLPLL
jgi:hypothetical protein